MVFRTNKNIKVVCTVEQMNEHLAEAQLFIQGKQQATLGDSMAELISIQSSFRACYVTVN